MLNSAFPDVFGGIFLQIWPIGVRIFFGALIDVIRHCSNYQGFHFILLKVFSDVRLRNYPVFSSVLRFQGNQFSGKKEGFKRFIHTVKFPGNMPHTFSMCAVRMWVKLDIIKICGSSFTHLSYKISISYGLNYWYFQIPDNWVFVVSPKAQRNIQRFGEINPEGFLVVVYFCDHINLRFKTGSWFG